MGRPRLSLHTFALSSICSDGSSAAAWTSLAKTVMWVESVISLPARLLANRSRSMRHVCCTSLTPASCPVGSAACISANPRRECRLQTCAHSLMSVASHRCTWTWAQS
jgi:hypothetical protein